MKWAEISCQGEKILRITKKSTSYTVVAINNWDWGHGSVLERLVQGSGFNPQNWGKNKNNKLAEMT
jgi:hypothetical protein